MSRSPLSSLKSARRINLNVITFIATIRDRGLSADGEYSGFVNKC